jgi:hypothetical protein
MKEFDLQEEIAIFNLDKKDKVIINGIAPIEFLESYWEANFYYKNNKFKIYTTSNNSFRSYSDQPGVNINDNAFEQKTIKDLLDQIINKLDERI